jgi:hypothetical protein
MQFAPGMFFQERLDALSFLLCVLGNVHVGKRIVVLTMNTWDGRANTDCFVGECIVVGEQEALARKWVAVVANIQGIYLTLEVIHHNIFIFIVIFIHLSVRCLLFSSATDTDWETSPDVSFRE